MGHVLKRPNLSATDRRPSKILRQRNLQLVNLSTYTHSTPLQVPVLQSKQACVKPTAPQRTHSEYVKLESQPFDTKAATNDTAFGQTGSEPKQPLASPKNQLTVIILSSLCLGSLVGYQWSSLVYLTPVSGNQTKSQLVIERAASETTEPPKTNVALVAPVLSQTQTQTQAQSDTAIARENQYRLKEKDYLSQIDWLSNQNNAFTSELDALKTETLDQNRELLALELEVAALRSQSEPPTETRVIYNFVNTPVGSSRPVQFGGSNAQYDEDALEDSDESLTSELEEQRAQYNEEGQLVYDLKTRKYIGAYADGYVERDSEGNPEELDYENSPAIDSTNYSGSELESYETVNSELLNELQQVRLRQFEAGLLDYDHETGTFVQKDFAKTNN